MSSETLWLICLVITHVCAFILGKSDGAEEKPLDCKAQLELEKYKYDKLYEHERWMVERKDNLRATHCMPTTEHPKEEHHEKDQD